LKKWIAVRRFRPPCLPEHPGPPVPSLLVGVGHKNHAVPLMRRAKGCRRDAFPFRIEPERGQVPENVSEAPIKEPWDVLHDDVAGS
jgi:hypothetical protein